MTSIRDALRLRAGPIEILALAPLTLLALPASAQTDVDRAVPRASGSTHATQPAPRAPAKPPPPQQKSSAPAAPAATEEVTVTAQHRLQSSQRVPIDITVVSGRQLLQEHIERPVDLSRVAPGLSTTNSTSGGTPIFAIRGVGLDDFNPNNTSGVAIYVDGVPVDFSEILNGALFDIDRVEVLKGPQGTLYGRNATGGAINIFTQQPTDATHGFADVSYGRWNTVLASAGVGGTIAPTLTGRVSVDYDRAYTGWQKDADTGRESAEPNRFGTRGLLRWQPDDRWTATLNTHFSRDRSLSQSPQTYGNEALLGPASAGQIDTPSTDATVVRNGPLTPRVQNVGAGTALTVSYEADAFTLSSISSYDHFRYVSIDNNSGTPGPTYWFFQDDVFDGAYQEFRLASTHGLFNRMLDWSTGFSLDYNHQLGRDGSDQTTSFIGAYADPPNYTESGLSYAQADYIQQRLSLGWYANSELHLTSRLSLIGGIRLSHDEVSFDGNTRETGTDDGGVLFHGRNAIITALDQDTSYDSLSFRAGAEYRITPRAMAYFTVSDAWKPQAYYASPALDPSAWGYVKPERLLSYEAGAKSELFDRRVTLNGSLFDYEYKDRQSLLVFVSRTDNATVSSLANIPAARVRGGEVDLHWRATAALTLGGSLTYLDSAVTETLDNVRGSPLYTPVPVGTELAQSPRFAYMLNGRYDFPFVHDWQPSVEVDWEWAGRQYSQLGDPHAAYGPLPQLNANLRFTNLRRGLSVDFWARNMLDSNATTYSFTSFYGGRTVYRLQPVSYGGELNYHF